VKKLEGVCEVCVCWVICYGLLNLEVMYLCWVNFKETGGGEYGVYVCRVRCEEVL
jgi:hypothetical protein